jgi:hypothetical protein
MSRAEAPMPTITVIASCRSCASGWTMLVLEDSTDQRRAHERRLACNDRRAH